MQAARKAKAAPSFLKKGISNISPATLTVKVITNDLRIIFNWPCAK